MVGPADVFLVPDRNNILAELIFKIWINVNISPWVWETTQLMLLLGLLSSTNVRATLFLVPDRFIQFITSKNSSRTENYPAKNLFLGQDNFYKGIF